MNWASFAVCSLATGKNPVRKRRPARAPVWGNILGQDNRGFSQPGRRGGVSRKQGQLAALRISGDISLCRASAKKTFLATGAAPAARRRFLNPWPAPPRPSLQLQTSAGTITLQEANRFGQHAPAARRHQIAFLRSPVKNQAPTRRRNALHRSHDPAALTSTLTKLWSPGGPFAS